MKIGSVEKLITSDSYRAVMRGGSIPHHEKEKSNYLL